MNKFNPNPNFVKKAHIRSLDHYREIYQESIKNPESFWSKTAERLDWFKKWDKVREYDFVSAH